MNSICSDFSVSLSICREVHIHTLIILILSLKSLSIHIWLSFLVWKLVLVIRHRATSYKKLVKVIFCGYMFIWLYIYNLSLFCPSKLKFYIFSWIINEHFWKITFSVHIIKYSIFYINKWKIHIIDIKYGRLKEMKTLPNLCHSIYLNWSQIGRSFDCGEDGLGVFQLSDRVIDGGDDEDGVTLCVMKNQMQGRIVPDLNNLKQHFLQCGFVRCRDRYFIYFLFIRNIWNEEII